MMGFKGISNHLKLHLEYLKVAFSTALEYKLNFLIQVLAMMMNNVVWLVFWFIFFLKFESVEGWNFESMLMLYSILTFAWGGMAFFFGHAHKIAILIAQGRMDFYLTLPKSRLYHIIMSRSSFFALGDLVFGLILAILVVPLHSVPLFIVLCITGMIIFMSLGIIFNSLAFYMGNAEATASSLVMGMLTLASYPVTIFKGAAKFILLTIVPAGFVSGIPVELLTEFNLHWFMLTILFALTFLFIAVFIFYKGLRRYESGNLMYVRM